jgi:hypothetical protein
MAIDKSSIAVDKFPIAIDKFSIAIDKLKNDYRKPTNRLQINGLAYFLVPLSREGQVFSCHCDMAFPEGSEDRLVHTNPQPCRKIDPYTRVSYPRSELPAIIIRPLCGLITDFLGSSQITPQPWQPFPLLTWLSLQPIFHA